jgi:hypothetical protein
MLRVIGMTLVVVTGAVNLAHAESWNDRPTANGTEAARHHSPTGAEGVQLQIGGGLAYSPIQQDQGESGPFDLARTEREQRVRLGRRLVRSRSAEGRTDEWLNLASNGKPTLAYSLTDALSIGVDYHYDSGENMNFKVAKVGGLDPNFHSHNFLLEAHLEF